MKTKKKSEFARHSLGDKSILIAGYILLGLFVVAIILPVIYIILASFIDPVTLQNSGITFDFSKWTLTAYERVMSNAQMKALLLQLADRLSAQEEMSEFLGGCLMEMGEVVYG